MRDGRHRDKPDRPIHIFPTSSPPFTTTRTRPTMQDARRAAQTRRPRYLRTIYGQNKKDQTVVEYDRVMRAYRGRQTSTRHEGSKRRIDTMEVTTKKRKDWADKSDSSAYRKSEETRLKNLRSTKQGSQVYKRARGERKQLLECRKARSSG
jgi:hypothetical protein